MQNPEAFIRANTRPLAPPLVPEIRLQLAEESLPIWQKTEEELGEMNVPPPYWAFAWAGGQALSRYVLDNRDLVRDRRVLDLGAGSGVQAVAAAMAGARSVLAADIDTLAIAACRVNAALNGVLLDTSTVNLLAAPPDPDLEVIFIGDLYYERSLSELVIRFVDLAADQGALILIGDPQRNYFPKGRYQQVAEYHVPVTRELEDAEIKLTRVWRHARPG